MQNELQIKDNCKYFLHGHYPISAKSYISELSDITSAGKDPDRYGQGEELQSFERELADFFGFEDCIFLQSGTMAQLIALRIWSDRKKNSTVAFHPLCHLELHEQMAYQKLHNLKSILVGQKHRLIIEGEASHLREKALNASKNTKIWGFAHLQAIPDSTSCKLEWYVGDATMDLSTEEIADYVNRVVID